MTKISSLSIFFPAYNEQENIKKSVQDAVEVAKSITNDYEIIVVNDGSRDKTGEIVNSLIQENPHIQLITHNPNQGYGAAVISGFKAATKEYVFFTDADLQFDLKEIKKLTEKLDKYDVVLGYRAIRNDPFMRLLNAKSWNFLNKLLFGLKVKDIDCAFKIFKTDLIKKLNVTSRGAMMSAELLIRLNRKNIAWTEVPVTHLPRVAGSPTGAKPKVILRAFKELFQIFFTTDLGRKGIKEISKFGAVGAISTIIDFAILNICVKFISLTIPIATFWGFIFGTVNGYLLNNRWTFSNRKKSANSSDLLKYTVISAVGLGITELIMHELTVKSDLNYNLSKLIAVFVVFFWNFFINRAWTFKK